MKITLTPVGPGGFEHDLECWLCDNEQSAIYFANPHWVFMPCRECQKKYEGFWTPKGLIYKLKQLFVCT